jgi:hypothetical protein
MKADWRVGACGPQGVYLQLRAFFLGKRLPTPDIDTNQSFTDRTVPGGTIADLSSMFPSEISMLGIHLFQKVFAKMRDFNRIPKSYCGFFPPYFK